MHLVFVEARLLVDMLDGDDRRRLGVTSLEEQYDFALAEPSKLGGQKVHYWSWVSSAVRRLQHDAKREEEKKDESLVPLYPDAPVKITTNLEDKLKDLVVEGSVDAFGAAIGRALVRMFPSRTIQINLLFGGRSGSLVLTAKVFCSDGVSTRVETSCVVKVDKDEFLIEEEKNTNQILPHLGENAPRVLCGGAHYEGLEDKVSLGSRRSITLSSVFAHRPRSYRPVKTRTSHICFVPQRRC